MRGVRLADEAARRAGRARRFSAARRIPKCRNVVNVVMAGGKAEAKPDEPTGEMCPNCGHALVRRHGRFGAYVSCSNYPGVPLQAAQARPRHGRAVPEGRRRHRRAARPLPSVLRLRQLSQLRLHALGAADPGGVPEVRQPVPPAARAQGRQRLRLRQGGLRLREAGGRDPRAQDEVFLSPSAPASQLRRLPACEEARGAPACGSAGRGGRGPPKPPPTTEAAGAAPNAPPARALPAAGRARQVPGHPRPRENSRPCLPHSGLPFRPGGSSPRRSSSLGLGRPAAALGPEGAPLEGARRGRAARRRRPAPRRRAPRHGLHGRLERRRAHLPRRPGPDARPRRPCAASIRRRAEPRATSCAATSTPSTTTTSRTRRRCAGEAACPSDPPFDNTEIGYEIAYTLSGVLLKQGDRYVLDHNFALPDAQQADRSLLRRSRSRSRLDSAAGLRAPPDRAVSRARRELRRARGARPRGGGRAPAAVRVGTTKAIRAAIFAVLLLATLADGGRLLPPRGVARPLPRRRRRRTRSTRRGSTSTSSRFCPRRPARSGTTSIGAPEVTAVLARSDRGEEARDASPPARR